MTYCVGIELKAGLDQISTSRKMIVYEKPGDRFMVLLSAGNFIEAKAETPYFLMMHNTWGQKLREVFDGIDDPVWDGSATATPLLQPAQRVQALKKIQTPDDKLI
jgi:predicted proteasome-type protease